MMMLLFYILAFALTGTQAVYNRRLCPCVPCEAAPVVDLRTWRRHTSEIAQGVRERACGVQPAAPRAPPPPAGEVDGNDGSGNDADEQIEAASEEVDADAVAEDDSELQYSVEMAELVGRGVVNATGMESVLKATHARYQHHLEEGVRIPPTWYMAKKHACEDKEPVWFTRDFCKICDHLFEEDKSDKECPRCNKDTRYDARGKSCRQAYYFSLDDKMRRLFESKFMAERVLPPAESARDCTPMRSRELTGAFSGSIMEDLYHECKDESKDSTLFFACSNDGVEVEKKISYTPIVAKLLNLPAALRSQMACFWLLGYMPPKVKDYQAMLHPVVDMFAARAPCTGDPLDVWSAATDADQKLWAVCAWNINDIRAFPSTTCGTAPPAYVGSCNLCEQPGIRPRGMGTQVLPGAVRFLGQGRHASYFRHMCLCLSSDSL